MPVSKVIYGGNPLIDLTLDTVAADKLLLGYTAHARDGTAITGTHVCSVEGHHVTVGTIELSSASETMSITGLDFLPSRIMLILTESSSISNSKVRSAYSDGGALHCQYYTGATLLGATVTTNTRTGSATFSTGSVQLSTGSTTYTFINGTWTYVVWD